MSENIEKAVPTEESPKTKESETSAPAATDNVVLYPVVDISAAQETTDTETAASKEITDPRTQIIKQLSTAKLPTVKLPITQTNSVTPEIQKNFRKRCGRRRRPGRRLLRTTGKIRSKDEHPFREFFSNFRSKRKIEMNRDEQILSRISDEDLMEYLRMEQKRMELLQQAKEVREKDSGPHSSSLSVCYPLSLLFIF